MRADQRSYGLHSVFVAGLPLLLLAIFVWSSAADKPSKEQATSYVKNDLMTAPALSRLVVVIVDSMGERNGSDPKLMPNLSALNKANLSGPQRSCAANFTLPCLLTTFEGRESPFLRALDNFSASASANPNWLGALRDQGRRIAIVSDHTLLQLYPQTFVIGENYEALQIDHDKRDQYAYSKALNWVDERKHDVLIIHIIGTDKASHRYRPGTPEYRAAFNAADDFVGQLSQKLDFKQDTMLVLGDHGHGDGGHHNREAWYTMAGPKVRPQTLKLEQTSLLYLLSRAAALPLPKNYEGKLLWTAFDDPAGEQSWRSAQANAWGLSESSREALETELDRRTEIRSQRPLNNALGFLPWWLNLVFILSALARLFQEKIEPTRGFLRGQLTWLTAAVILGPWVAWPALIIQLIVSKVTLRGALGLISMLVWSGLVFGSGLAIPTIAEYFHIKSGVDWTIVYWFAGIIGIPLLVGILTRPLDTGTRLAQASLLVLFAATLLTTPGVYYYGWAQNLCRFLIPLVLLAIILEVKPFDRRGILLLLALATGLTTIRISAGGWDWSFRIINVFNDIGETASLSLAALLLLLNTFIWRRNYPKGAWVAVFFLFVVGWLLVGPFGFEAKRIPGFALTILCTSAGLRLLEPEEGEQSTIKNAWQIVLIAGVCVIATLIASDGFYLRSLRFEFALNWLADTFNEEWALALVAIIIVAWKYALAFLPILIASLLTVGLNRCLHLGKWVVLILCVKLVGQTLQMTGVSFVEEEKMSELLLQEMVGFFFIATCLWSAYLKLSIGHHLHQWTFGKDQATEDSIQN